MTETTDLRDAIVTLPVYAVESFAGKAASNEQKIRNITRWDVVDSQLVLSRAGREVARFKEWIGVRSLAVES